MFGTNNFCTIHQISLTEPAVRWALPVVEVLELLVTDLHGLWDQLRRLLQELRHILGVKGLLVVVKVVLKAEESIQHVLEVLTRIKYLMLRQFKGYYTVIQLLRDVIDNPIQVRLNLQVLVNHAVLHEFGD